MSTNDNPLDGVELGIGTWAWGDKLVWGYGGEHSEIDVYEAFQASLEAGVTFFDTAELYGFGTSEKLLGRFLKRTGQSVVVATKFMPWPWRLQPASLIKALRKSNERLGVGQVDLYQIHQPIHVISIETWMDAMADAVTAGLTRTVGVSNYNRSQTQRAYQALEKRGIPLVSNQMEYHLLNRSIERNGVFDFCREHGIKIIAYSPLGQGLLTGKYTPSSPPPGVRKWRYRDTITKIGPLVDLLREIGTAHDQKTPAQVALNWIICKGAIPIPGAKNAHQARQNAEAAGWRLTADEVAALDEASAKIQ